MELSCPECRAMMTFKQTSKYGRPFYICEFCGITHGCHSNGQPFGNPANKETRQLRIQAHNIFDKWWKSYGINRRQAYKTLAQVLNIRQTNAHIGMFDKEQCLYVIRIFGENQGIFDKRLSNPGEYCESIN